MDHILKSCTLGKHYPNLKNRKRIGKRERKMNLSLLDNGIWHAINSYHQHLAIKGKSAGYYKQDVFFGAAMPANKPEEFSELRDLVSIDETIGVVGSIPKNIDGWE